MEIVYYKDPIGNFGDDLNELLWPRLLPGDVRACARSMLVGVGSLLDQPRFRGRQTAGRPVYVLGSGAAYGALPDGWQDWTFLAVRGPLTARLIGKPEAAVTDSAALLSTLPALTPPVADPQEVIFVPHHRTSVNSRWPEAARAAGLTYVDPCGDTQRVLDAFGRAKLVVTEAMHGAIVADTLRIPWVPVIVSSEVSLFKWRDWVGSLDLPYRPVMLPPTTRLEAYRYDRIRRVMRESGREMVTVERAAMSDDALLDDFHARFASEPEVVDAVAAPRGAKQLLKSVIERFDGPLVARAAKALAKAATMPAYLSSDRIFGQRVEQLEASVARLVREVRAAG